LQGISGELQLDVEALREAGAVDNRTLQPVSEQCENCRDRHIPGRYPHISSRNESQVLENRQLDQSAREPIRRLRCRIAWPLTTCSERCAIDGWRFQTASELSVVPFHQHECGHFSFLGMERQLESIRQERPSHLSNVLGGR
jgi:hypothetical protein